MRMHKWAWAGLILTGVNCVAILDDHPYREGDTNVQGKACQTDSNCEDGNPCTTDTCSSETLICEYLAQADGLAPDSAQTAADCQSVQCVGGKPVYEEEPQDVLNDNNSCTTDSCLVGTPDNEVLPDDTMCTQGETMGSCKAGTCTVACATNTDCNDGNPCTGDLCNTSAGACVYTKLDGLPTPDFNEVVGDCMLHICADGVDTAINDDADVFDDNNPCTADVCSEGAPSSTAVMVGIPCVPGDVNVCDGKGACVECTTASHCVNIIETECEKRSCVDNKCEIAYQGTSTLASPVLQTARDCKKVVCNGPNGTTTVNDDADLPDDSNPCTKNICTNGAPSNPPEAQNFACGSGQVCNGVGTCVGCTSASQCAGTDDFCKTRTCNSNVCGFSYTANGTDLPMVDQTAGDCKVRECDGMGNVKTSVFQGDVPVDGNQCTQDSCSAQGNPSNAPTPINSACSVGGNDACDGNGSCKKSLGKTCGGSAECVSAVCVDGVCCNSSCTTTCRACNVAGSVGTCSDVPKGQDDGTCTGPNVSCNVNADCDDEIGQTCAGAASCLSGFCADGVCCNSACNTACKSCNVTGSVGTCGNLPLGSQDSSPTNLCIGMSQCDGNGNCQKVNGASCNSNNDCLGLFCVDGVCCDSACTTTCLGCNVAGSLGTCTNLPYYTDDTMCNSSGTCNGLGACKFKNGEICMSGTICASNKCVGGICMP